MPGSRLNTKNRVSLKTSVLTIVIHTAVPLRYLRVSKNAMSPLTPLFPATQNMSISAPLTALNAKNTYITLSNFFPTKCRNELRPA
jgi:hypothetical protein